MLVTDYLKGLTSKDFIYTGATVWSKITPLTIEGSWMRGLSSAFPSNKDMKDVAAVDDIKNDLSDDDDGDFVEFSPGDLADVNWRSTGRQQETAGEFSTCSCLRWHRFCFTTRHQRMVQLRRGCAN